MSSERNNLGQYHPIHSECIHFWTVEPLRKTRIREGIDEKTEKLLQTFRESQTTKPTGRQVKVMGFHRYLTRMPQI
jgi:hypothetical protein